MMEIKGKVYQNKTTGQFIIIPSTKELKKKFLKGLPKNIKIKW